MGQVEAARKVFAKVCRVGHGPQQTSGLATTSEAAATTMLRVAKTPASGLGGAWQHIAHVMRSLGFGSEATRAYRWASASA